MANWWLTWTLVNLSIKEFIGRVCWAAYKIKFKKLDAEIKQKFQESRHSQDAKRLSQKPSAWTWQPGQRARPSLPPPHTRSHDAAWSALPLVLFQGCSTSARLTFGTKLICGASWWHLWPFSINCWYHFLRLDIKNFSRLYKRTQLKNTVLYRYL